MKLTSSRLITGLLAICLYSSACIAQNWVTTWATSPMLVEPQNSLAADQQDITVRQVVHVSIGGPKLVLRLSNRYGADPLQVASVHIAQAVAPGSSKTVPGTDKPLSFGGVTDVTIPAGADYLSDPIEFPVPPLSDVAITLYLKTVPKQQTGHTGSHANSFVAAGNQVSATELANVKTVEHWYFIAGIDVPSSGEGRLIVALGDSITDGHGATTDKNNRWPDLLAKRLQDDPTTRHIAIVNQGIGGNGVLRDFIGSNALARFDHDVLAQAGVHWVILLEGINDLGRLTRDGEVTAAEHQALVRNLIAGYQQVIRRAHQQGLFVIGATLLPFVGGKYYHPGPDTEADREAINEWIRTPGHFDAVVDFDKATRDPSHPDRMLPEFDSGDHLHPSPEGFAAMAESVPLALFANTGSSSGASENEAPKIAFTFDDLPAHGPLPTGETRLGIITKIIQALREGHVPPTYGFVNGRLLEDQPGDASVLKAWRDAGNPLGNHAWSHMNLNQRSLADWETDVEQNEATLAARMKGADWHWFRYPYLSEGETPEKRESARKFLAQRGYKIATVTMSFGDYQWSDAYARCLTKGDPTTVQALKDSYLKAADDSVPYYRTISKSLYGRDIPYVLLMHVGAVTADMLPQLIELYRSKGFEFVSLEQAEQDAFYKIDIDPSLTAGHDLMENAARERNVPLPKRPAVPQFDSLCR